MPPADDAREGSDSELAAPRPRGRSRKGCPVQASATSEEPRARSASKAGTPPAGTAGRAAAPRSDQDAARAGSGEPDAAPSKRTRSSADDEGAGSDAGGGDPPQQQHQQQHQPAGDLLPAKRKRTQLFNVKELLAADRGEGLPPVPLAAPYGAPPGGRSTQKPRQADQEWAPLPQHPFAAGAPPPLPPPPGCFAPAMGDPAAAIPGTARPSGPSPPGFPGYRQGDAAAAGRGGPYDHQGDFNPDAVPKGAHRDMALQRERRLLAEAAQAELGADSLSPDTNVATLVQRILKCGVLTRKVVEYRKRAKGMGPADYNRGTVTSAGLIRCACHNQDVTMSEFEQHSNSQIHRPAEYIFIKCIDMSLKNFAVLVLSKPVDGSLWYCLACNDGGDLLCCDGCPAAFHAACLGAQAPPAVNSEWLCGDCLMAGKKPRWSARGPLRRFTPLAGAASAGGAPAAAATGSMRRSNSIGSSIGRAGGGATRSGGDGMGGGAGSAAKAAAAAAPLPYGPAAAGFPGPYGGSSGGGGAYYEEDPHMAAAAAAAAGYGPLHPAAGPGPWGGRGGLPPSGYDPVGGPGGPPPAYLLGPGGEVGRYGGGGGGAYDATPGYGLPPPGHPAAPQEAGPPHPGSIVLGGGGGAQAYGRVGAPPPASIKPKSGGGGAPLPLAGCADGALLGDEGRGVLEALAHTLRSADGAEQLLHQFQHHLLQQGGGGGGGGRAPSSGGSDGPPRQAGGGAAHGREQELQHLGGNGRPDSGAAREQAADLEALATAAAAAAAAAAGPPAQAGAAPAADAATAAQLLAAAVSPGVQPLTLVGELLSLTRHLSEAGTSDDAAACTALLRAAAAAAAPGGECAAGAPLGATKPAAGGPRGGHGAAPAAEASVAGTPPAGGAGAGDDSATTAHGNSAGGRPAGEEQQGDTEDQGMAGLAAGGCDLSPTAAAAATAASVEPQQQRAAQMSPGAAGAEARRQAVADALRAGSLLVGSVLGARSLSDAQREVARCGAQLLASLAGLL